MLFSVFKLLLSVNERCHTPANNGIAKVSLVHDLEHIRADSLCIFVKPLFTSRQSNSPENFDAHGAAGNRADDVDSILLSTDVFAPGAKNLPFLLDIGVVRHPVRVGFESLIEALLESVTFVCLVLEFLI